MSLISFIISVHKLINLLSHLLSTATVRKDGAPSVRFVFPKSKCNIAREQGRVFGTFRYINENISFLKYHLSTLKLKQVIKKTGEKCFPAFFRGRLSKNSRLFWPELGAGIPALFDADASIQSHYIHYVNNSIKNGLFYLSVRIFKTLFVYIKTLSFKSRFNINANFETIHTDKAPNVFPPF